VYDDVECPAVVELKGRFYLIGSIREDIKVHYWHSDRFRGEYASFPGNILLPPGNYAARVSRDEDRVLLYSFFVAGREVETAHRYFCPPKELDADESGRLILRSLRNWQQKISAQLPQAEFAPLRPLFGNPSATLSQGGGVTTAGTSSGYEAFGFLNPFSDFIWRGKLRILRPGKLGLLFNANEDADGYYLSLDPLNGLIPLRAWAAEPENIYKDYHFETLQSGAVPGLAAGPIDFELLRYGHYIEFSVDGAVILSLIDAKFHGALLGLYAESAELELASSHLLELRDSAEDELSQQFDATAGDWRIPPWPPST
jgi:beta-fructofuranosidase